MPRPRERHAGTVRGSVSPGRYMANIQLDHKEALGLIRHVAEALKYSKTVEIEPHWGRRGGERNTHRIDIRST